MPVSVEAFEDSEDIFIYHFVGYWTWEEAYQAIEKYKNMVEKIDGRVDNIVDFSKSKVIPTGAVTHLQAMAKIRPTQTHLAVFVSDNRFGHILINIAGRLSQTIREKYQIASTIEEALDMITESRANDVST